MGGIKRLGQHFLINRLAAKKIIDALDLQAGEMIIEIGPGRGALTIPLVRACKAIGCRILALEKDKTLATFLRDRSPISRDREIVEIFTGDALKILPSLTSHLPPLTSFKLVGNIPYYITGRLLRILSELENKPRLTVLTIQKEVAERITAKPPKMNLLSAITQFWAEPEIIARLKPADFSPRPKVASAIIKLTSRSTSNLQPLNSNFYRFVKILFKQPRKTVLNNLKAGLKISPEAVIKILKRQGLTGKERPQDLSLKMLTVLAVSLN